MLDIVALTLRLIAARGFVECVSQKAAFDTNKYIASSVFNTRIQPVIPRVQFIRR